MVEILPPIPAHLGPQLAARLAGQQTLEDVVRWGLSRTPPRLIARVVVQDEYTHDVVLPWEEGVYLAYDTT